MHYNLNQKNGLKLGTEKLNNIAFYDVFGTYFLRTAKTFCTAIASKMTK